MGIALSFDATKVKPNTGYPPPVPLSEYNVMVTGSGKETTKDGTGEYLFFDLKVMDGAFAGRTQTDRLNLWNKDAKTVEIAQERLSAYCHVTKKYRMSNTEELHGIPFRAVMGPQVGKDGVASDKYGEVKELKNADGTKPTLTDNAPAATAAPATAPQFGPPATVATPPPPPNTTAAPPPPPATDPSASWQRSDDGAWKLNPATNAWEANTVATPPPPPAPAAAAQFGAPPAPAASTTKAPWES
jgi:hypothetical protein